MARSEAVKTHGGTDQPVMLFKTNVETIPLKVF